MKTLQDILDAAERHGQESEPGHEVGDLQDMLRYTWSILTEGQKDHVMAEAVDMLEDWAGEIHCEACDGVGEPDCKTCGGEGLLTATGRRLC